MSQATSTSLVTVILWMISVNAFAEEVQPVIPCDSIPKTACSQEYTPVCANRGNLKEWTFPNPCMACKDPDSIGYKYGACQKEVTP